MSTRRLLFVAILCSALASDVFAQATSVTVQLFPFTGEVRLLNENPDPFAFTLYSLTSASNALNGAPAEWKSIADTYDVSGNGFIDPTNSWLKLSTGPMQLSEAVFTGTGGVLPAYRAISLGQIWNPNTVPTHDIVAQVKLPNGLDAAVDIALAVDGDYLRDGDVNDADYLIWKTYFGNTSDAYFADGNIDGIVDAADYTIWRDNFGRSLPESVDGPAEIGAGGLSGGSLSIGAVPEPASLVMFSAIGIGLFIRRPRRANPTAS